MLIVTIEKRSILSEHLPQEIHTNDNHVKTMTIPLDASSEDIERKVIRKTLMEVTHDREQAAQ